jgi:ribose-phosphate pyrophosphokinase
LQEHNEDCRLRIADCRLKDAFQSAIDNRQSSIIKCPTWTPTNSQVFTGRANRELARRSALPADPARPRPHGAVPDSECIVKVDEDVRGRDCYIVQPRAHPVNGNLMDLFIWIDTLKRASANRVTASIPYFGYARQDPQGRGPHADPAQARRNLIERAGADRVV